MELGKIIRTTLSIWSGQLIPFVAIAAALLIPSLLFDLFGTVFVPEGSKALARVGELVTGIGQNLFVGFAAFSTFHALKGQQLPLRRSMEPALRAIGQLALAGIIVNLCIGFGLLLCIIPGLIAFTMCYVVMPVIVVERCSAADALRRSAQLTEGHRPAILGAVTLTMLPMFVLYIGIIFGVGVGLDQLVGLDPDVDTARMVGISMDLLIWACSAPLVSLSAVLCSVIYAELRTIKNDDDIDALLNIFD